MVRDPRIDPTGTTTVLILTVNDDVAVLVLEGFGGDIEGVLHKEWELSMPQLRVMTDAVRSLGL